MPDDYANIADLYDFVVPYRERPDVPFWVDAAQRTEGAVLELGCGTGRVLIPTAREGKEITGLDASPAMLSLCKDRVAEEPAEVRERITLLGGDMRVFEVDRTFGLVTIPFRAFQHLLTVDDQLACLTSARTHLRDGGRVIVDVFNPSLEALVNRERGREFNEEPEFETPDGRRVVRRHKITDLDAFRQILSIELLYDVRHADGAEERLVHAVDMRYFFRYELEHLLARSGFELEAVYSGYGKEPFGSRHPSELIAVGRKPARAGIATGRART